MTRIKRLRKLLLIKVSLLIEILIMILSLTVFIQDIVSRSVHWIIFPGLILLFISGYGLRHHSLTGYWINPLINLTFIFVQLLLVSLWFSIKNKGWVNITRGMLGWGDVLFITSTACYFSPVNFIIFYVLSLIVITISWFTYQNLAANAGQHIPLAGLQALLLLIVFIIGLLNANVDPANDNWVLSHWPL